jgi:hypothetical protein
MPDDSLMKNAPLILALVFGVLLHGTDTARKVL